MTKQCTFGSTMYDGDQILKPLSITRSSTDRRSMLKVYRGIEPRERQRREVDALTRVGRWGIAVPEVLAAGRRLDEYWSIFRVVPGDARITRTDVDVRAYLCDVRALAARLAAASNQLAPGAGWEPSLSDPPDHRQYLLDQLSPRCRRYDWWTELIGELRVVDSEPAVYLHGDLKAEHFLLAEHETYVVDWEACGRGPAACDFADVVFHVIRDLLYDGTSIEEPVIHLLAELGAPGAVLAWRLVRWLDRRRPHDMSMLSSGVLCELAHEGNTFAACRRSAQTVADLQAAGVPR
ncbi:aminoglycoside phosphotransferase family protein [Kribbella pittospori]|uniref:aminoglycoside phosphotransferase family protein n=1 Tax=Kribbella pittospori TaxID=722689 RepID=UPI0013F3A90E|nr:aminoglycoside phosphotransferase family protein [Kribbella pittospori]